MSLADTVADVTARLRQGLFPNEQSISQGIVLRLLQDLGWQTWDTTLVWPEYQTGEGRVDFALCHPPRKPAVFVEVKQPGGADDGVRQALEYGFHTGVPFVALTDGKTWSFYLPAEQGSYDERRVFKLDLFERDAGQAAAILERYLSKARVDSGEALEGARQEYRMRNRSAQARAAIPEAWQELVERGDETLVALLTDAVESKAGVRPEGDDITDFLSALGIVPRQSYAAGPDPRPRTETLPTPRTARMVDFGGSSRSGTLVLRGKSYHYPNAKEAMMIVLRELATEDPTFLERCARHPHAQGTERRHIARSPEELFPFREDLRKFHEQLPSGWCVSTNLNNPTKKTIIRLAAEVAGLVYGRDVTVEF